MSRLRVINLGLPKSGTTTLGVALKESGLKVADWRIRRGQTENREIAGNFVGRVLYRGYFKTGDPLHYMDEFDAFTEISVASRGHNEWPQTDWGLLSAIIDHHPGAKFLYSSRSADKLVDSMLRWSNLGRRRLPKNPVPGLPAGYGFEYDELVRWVEGHRKFCHRVFAGSDAFMEYDILDPDAPQKIGDFLGMEITWWGKANTNENRKAAPEETSGDMEPAQEQDS